MREKSNSDLLTKLFFNMLPVQTLIFAMGSVNSIVDGAMAGRFIDTKTVGVIGLFFSMAQIFLAIGYVLLGGTSILCGRYMGKGDLESTQGIFSLNVFLISVASFIMMFLFFGLPSLLADILGATYELKPALVSYIMGYGIGIFPMLMAQQIAFFLQLERQNKRGYFGVAGMIMSNIIFNVIFVAVLKLGTWGLALATSLSNWVYFIILIPYYLSAKAQLHFRWKKILWKDAGKLLYIGFPGALLVFSLSIRYLVINRILIIYGGNDGLSAMAAFSMVSGLFIAYCLGNGSIVRTLVSVFVGEEDKESIRKILKVAMTKGLALSLVVSAIIVVISPLLSQLFFPDRSSNVFHLTYQLLIIYAFCIPLVLICQIFTNYMQAIGHTAFVNFQSVFDGFFSMVIPAVILAPIMGAFGVWLSNPIGIILTILTVPIYCIVYWKRVPKTKDEMLFFKPEFGIKEEDTLDFVVSNLDDVSESSKAVQTFCQNHGMEKKPSLYAALCLEEMAANIVQHGFSVDKKKHSVAIKASYLKGDMLLRIKDDCVPFNPGEMAELVGEASNNDSMGIRLIYKIADEVIYQNMLGLNVLTISIKEENFIEEETKDFLLEKSLAKLDRDLHKRFVDMSFAAGNVLSEYRRLFPEYTDHSELHSMTVIDSCNRLIGEKQIKMLNADEMYILLAACYLHDVGMGINTKDFEEFRTKVDRKGFFQEHPDATDAEFVRAYHNEFSGMYIEKYADVYEIPSKEHVFAIKQVARGHRKTDLFDENEYPAEYRLLNGNTVCIPYLAAIIRIADEIDCVASRNPMILYDINILKDDFQIKENKKLYAIKSMKMTEEAFILYVEEDDPKIIESIENMAEEMQRKLDYCRDVISKRTKFKLSQKKVLLRWKT